MALVTNKLWSVSAGGATDLVMNANTYLRSEMGIELRKVQDANTIEAIATPATFITNRSAKIDALFHATTGKVTLAFQQKYEELQNLFLPDDVCKSMAKATAARVYQEQLELLELEAPDGYKKSFGIASAAHNATIETNAIAGSGINEHEVIAKYKSYRRAKKAAKKEKK